MALEIERRDEWFETTIDLVPHTVRVTNNVRVTGVSIQIQNRMNIISAGLTPDEADQLAEMLRLSARGLRVAWVEDQPPDPLRTALQNLLAIAEIAEFYLPGELAESAERVHADIASAKNILNGVSKS